MSIKMIAVDMDGTFLNKQSSYNHERFLKVYQQLKERNIRFVVASGNPYKQLQGNFEEMKDELTYIAENGGYIVEKENEIFLACIEDSDVHKIIDGLKTMPDVLCWVCTKNQSYTLNSLSDHYYQMFLPYFPGVKRIEDFTMIEEPILKFALFLPEKNIEERINDFVNIVSHHVHVVDSGHYCVDLIPYHVNKGEAITMLMERYHLSQDEVMAFGDAGNDEEMLKKVKYGYAMMNAKDEFKNKFDYIAPTNDEDGVLQVIENYLEKDIYINLKEEAK